MIKYTGEKKYEKAVIAAVEDWLRHHLPAGSTGVKLYEVELLDLDDCDIKARVNYDINYSGVYEDEFENVTDEISFETDRAICDTFRESLQAEDEDGWGEQIEEELAQSLDFAADIAYEVRNCVRGSYVIDGDKVEDLVKSLRSLVDGLEIAIENIESDAKSINESVEKRDVFCTDCDTVTTQTYKGSFKDGIRILGRYICDRCGCENEDEPLAESKSIREGIGYNPEYYSYIEEVAQRFEAGEYDDAYEVCEYVANKFNKDINTVRDDINKLIDESKSIREGVHRIYVNGELRDEIESSNPVHEVDPIAYKYKKLNGVKEVRIEYADGTTNTMQVESINKFKSIKEDYGNLKEIDRKLFKTLETDGNGNYFILNDYNFEDKFYANSDEEAIKRFRDKVNESKSIKESTKKSYIFSKNESKYYLNSK